MFVIPVSSHCVRVFWTVVQIALEFPVHFYYLVFVHFSSRCYQERITSQAVDSCAFDCVYVELDGFTTPMMERIFAVLF